MPKKVKLAGLAYKQPPVYRGKRGRRPKIDPLPALSVDLGPDKKE